MSTKVKSKAKTNITYEAACEAALSYANAQASIQRRTANMAAAINKVKTKYESQIDEAEELKTEAKEVLKAYADQERGNWKNNSTTLRGIKISYRKGARAVQVDEEKIQIVVSNLKTAGLKRFLRIKEELDKPAILKVKEPAIIAQFEECEIKFGQSETFLLKQ